MPPRVMVKSDDVAVKARREAAAQRVIVHFGNQLPALRLLCFFDDIDWQPFKRSFGEANRGFYKPLKEEPLPNLCPDYLRKQVFVENPPGASRAFAFDHVIYLHGGTCSSELGLTMTFSHELQHFVQHANVLTLWAANSLIPMLDKSVIQALGLKWSDIPIEREARIVSKRTAENLFGPEAVRQHIDARIAESVNANDADDWKFIRELVASDPYDLARETKLLFPRLKDYRSELEGVLQQLEDEPDFKDVDLDVLFGGANA